MNKLILFIIVSLSILISAYLIGNTTIVNAGTVRTLSSEIERLSKEYKVSTTTVNAIINCESEMYGSAVNHNIDKDGKIWSSDYGPFQINDYFHKGIMSSLGLNIYNQFDSLEYGFILLKKQGTKPWSASKKCWLTKI